MTTKILSLLLTLATVTVTAETNMVTVSTYTPTSGPTLNSDALRLRYWCASHGVQKGVWVCDVNGLWNGQWASQPTPAPTRQQLNALTSTELFRFQRTGVWSNGAWYVQTKVQRTATANPQYLRYWWLRSIAERYGKTLPCDVAEVRAAMQAYLAGADAATRDGILADAADAVACYFGNGGSAADWTKPPPATIATPAPILTPLPRP